MTVDVAAQLRAIPWPGERWAALVEPMIAHGRIVSLAAGQWVQAEGDEETGAVVVLSGALELYCRAPGDREVLISRVAEGTAFGQTERFGGGPRLLTVICREPARLLVLSDHALARIGAETPRIWEAVAGLLYTSLRNILYALAEATALPPRARVASRIELLARDLPPPRRLRLTQEALGEMVGLTRKTVNAHLAALEGMRLIRRTYGGLDVIDPAGLRRVAGRL